MNLRTNRLATRVTIIFFLAMAALLIVLAALFAWIIYDSQQTSTAALQRETAQRAAATIDAHLESLRAPIVNAVQLRADLLQAMSNDQQRFLTNLLVQNPSYIDLALLDEQGQVIAAVARMGHRLENVERDADRTAAFQAAQSGQPYLSRVHLATANREPYIVMSQPFDKSRGVLIVWMNLQHVWDITAQVQIGDSGYAYILDADGNLIASRDVARVIARENPLHNNPELRDLLRDPNAVSDYVGLNAETVLGAYAPIASTSWMIVVETPRREAYLILYRSLAFIAVLLVVSIALAAGIARYLAVRLLKPIDLLRRGVGLIAQGQLDHTIVIRTDDEIQELANEFNTMIASLRRARTENETWTRELEQRVEERTAQVIDQKQQLAVLEERQRIARELLTTFRATFARIGADAAHLRMQARVAPHQVRARRASFRAVYQRFEMRGMDRLTAHVDAVGEGLLTNVVAPGTILNTLLQC